ncbi:MAG: pyridoxamine 5'-phosphate oxidase family protein [Coriobacteriales bacterium]|nr:pyridoxamine 5'-phosphate oxidase family protein [Coriobacteriales bacterium]
MAKMTQDMQDLFNMVDSLAFGTIGENGQVNINIIGMKRAIDDETVYISDQFFKKTYQNLQHSNKVALTFWEGQNAYQIYGTAEYVNEGAKFEEQKAWADGLFAAKGLPIKAKGGCFIHVDEIYSSAAGPNAGEKLA